MKNQNSFSTLTFFSKNLVLFLLLSAFAGCGGGGSTTSSSAQILPVKATVVGLLSGQEITVQNTATGDSITVTQNGSFPISSMPFDSRYDVRVTSQPSKDRFSGCSVENGTNILDGTNDAIVKCGPVATTFTGTAGRTGGNDGPKNVATFGRPSGMAFDSLGNLYAADYDNGSIRKIDTNGNVTTWAGGMANPLDIAIDADDNLYVADRVGFILKVDTNANVTTFATIGYDTCGIALGKDGYVYVSACGLGKIVRFDRNGVSQDFAGSLNRGYLDGNGAAARFLALGALRFDSQGNLFELDFSRIRKITPNGDVTTFAGSGSYASVDGQGTAASFRWLGFLTIDSQDNLYVTDLMAKKILRIDTNANVTTFLGNSGAPAHDTDGQGSAVTFSEPYGIVLNNTGDTLFMSDFASKVIRKITPGAP